MQKYRILGLIGLLGVASMEALPLAGPGIEQDADIIDLRSFGTDLFGKPDEEITADRVNHYNESTEDTNPEELGTYLEGDMLVPRPVHLMRSGVPSLSHRWPKGIVPYEIRGNFSGQQIIKIEEIMEEYHTRSCIRFIPHTDEDDYIVISNSDSGCWSSVGRMGGSQELNLQTPTCLKRVGTAIHEMMHVLGFLHEQNREERDEYVRIIHDNIRAPFAKNFRKANSTVNFGVGYDYGSIMHYSRKAFSQNGLSTIKALKKRGRGVRMGQRVDFSEADLKKLNRMYNCTMEEEPVSLEKDLEEETSEATSEDTQEEAPVHLNPANMPSFASNPEIMDINLQNNA